MAWPGPSARRPSLVTCVFPCGPSSSSGPSARWWGPSSPTRSGEAPVATIVERYGKWLLLSTKDLDRAEHWFERYGSASVLLSRVIPVVRSFISVPAGIAEMNRARFAILTTIGSAVWVALLGGLGYAAGKNWKHVSSDFHAAEYPVIAVVVLGLAYAIWHRWRTIQRENAANS